MAKSKKITLDDLAVMTQNGFNDLRSDMNNGFTELRSEMDVRFNTVDNRFDKIEHRLDRIENIILREHDNRIMRLEDEVRMLKTSSKK